MEPSKQEQVLRELSAVAFGYASDENGSDMKYASKLRALEMLAKLLGMFDPQNAAADPVVIVDDLGG